MANIDALAGMRRMQAQKTNVPGTCLKVVYESYGSVPSIGPGAGRFQVALAGWNYSAQKHANDWNPPAGVPVYFGVSPTRWDKNKVAGDVAISLGGGLLIATDAPGGRVGVITIAARARQTQRPYLGWTGDFLGHQLVNIPAAAGATVAAASPRPLTMVANQDTKNRQEYLNANRGEKLVVDGIEGRATDAAYRRYQEYLGIPADGNWGPKTQAAHQADYDRKHPRTVPVTRPILQLGSKGPAVKLLQNTLNSKYPAYSKLKSDGDFGKGTYQVVCEFQRRAGLVPDGVVGPRTWASLGS